MKHTIRSLSGSYQSIKSKPRSVGRRLNLFGMGRNAGCAAGILCVVVGSLLSLFAIGVLFNFTPVFRFILGKKVVLSPSSQGYPIWRDVSEHLDTRVAWYFFNLTNPKQFVQGSVPELVEVGPFWYRAVLTKKKIKFNSENSTVSFEEHRHFEFDAEQSILPEDTNITMVNVPLMAVLNKLEPLGYFSRIPLETLISAVAPSLDLVTNYNISELTYTGRYDTLVAVSKIKEGFDAAYEALSSAESKKNKFGFAVDKNNTEPGIFNMFTGATGVNDLNRIYSMNSRHVLDIWPTDNNNVCNIVDGTFGYLRPPMNESNEQVVYVPDMCRTVLLRYQKDVELSGLRLRRFVLGPENFFSSSKRPENFCYNSLYGLPSGVSEVGPCKQGAPILMSMPHFMSADISFANDVEGMKPDPVRHTFIMDHEPTTGMTVSVRGRLQANLRIVQVSSFDADNLPNLLMPLFWQELYVEAGPGVISFLKKVNGYPGLAKISLIVTLLIGLIVAVIGAGLLINVARSSQRKETLSEKSRNVSYSRAAKSEDEARLSSSRTANGTV